MSLGIILVFIGIFIFLNADNKCGKIGCLIMLPFLFFVFAPFIRPLILPGLIAGFIIAIVKYNM